VINFELPNVPETYIHRIGRTGRAGKGGSAISLCDGEEREYLRDIERLTGKRLTVVNEHPFMGRAPRSAADDGSAERNERAPQRSARAPQRAGNASGNSGGPGLARPDAARPRGGRRPRANWSRGGRPGRGAVASA